MNMHMRDETSPSIGIQPWLGVVGSLGRPQYAWTETLCYDAHYENSTIPKCAASPSPPHRPPSLSTRLTARQTTMPRAPRFTRQEAKEQMALRSHASNGRLEGRAGLPGASYSSYSHGTRSMVDPTTYPFPSVAKPHQIPQPTPPTHLPPARPHPTRTCRCVCATHCSWWPMRMGQEPALAAHVSWRPSTRVGR